MGGTLLHNAASAGDEVAIIALVRHGLDVDARSASDRTPLHAAAFYGQTGAVLLLAAAGATLAGATGVFALELAMSSGNTTTVKALVGLGVRVDALPDTSLRMMPSIRVMRAGFVNCRAVCVVLLGLKRRRRGAVMAHLDRFVVREIAFACFATSCDKDWQANVMM